MPYLSSEMRQVNEVGVLLEFGDDQGSMADVLLRRPKNGKRESQTKGTVKKIDPRLRPSPRRCDIHNQ